MHQYADYDEEEDSEASYTPPVPIRRATAGHDVTFQQRTTQPPVDSPVKRQYHLLFYAGVGMLLFLGIWLVWNMLIVPWYHGIHTHWQYGENKVFVMGADVGHGGMSQFVAFDSENTIVVIEVLHKRYTVYTIPATVAPNTLITLSAQDVNRDGKLDVVVSVDGEAGSFVLFNTGSAFSWTSQ